MRRKGRPTKQKAGKQELPKTEWKSMRDQFKNVLRKLPRPKSGDAASSQSSRFAHLKSFEWLKDVVQPRETLRNIPVVDDSDQRENITSNESVSINHQTTVQMKSTKDSEQHYPELEKASLLMEDDGSDDDDLNFFKSLIPYMKQLQPLKKLSLRNQIQSMIASELEGQQQQTANVSRFSPASSSSTKVTKL